MIIGTTKELKNHEYRVGLTPDNVAAFVAKGHTVLVETHAGEGAGLANGLNIYGGKCVNQNVAKALNLPFTPVSEVI